MLARVREFRMHGSVRGAAGNSRPYRDHPRDGWGQVVGSQPQSHIGLLPRFTASHQGQTPLMRS
jgi:hypothetical protein